MTHLIPLNDIEPHELSDTCKCKPETEGGLVSHNSFDKRELAEEQSGVAAEGKNWTLIDT